MDSGNSIWQLISRSLSGEISQGEFIVLQEILKKDQLLQQQYDILQQFWHSSNLRAAAKDEEDDKRIAAILEKTKKATSPGNGFIFNVKRLRRIKMLSILSGSVIALILLISGVYFFSYSHTIISAPKAKLNRLVVQNGSRNRTILPDGSTVWLNAGSSLSYSGDFKGQNREVFLKGEAFFDVVKKNHQPFIVHANSVDIKVLGTAFNVTSYAEDNRVEATLIRGIIQVTRPGKINQEPVFLHPNEKLVINLDEATVYNKPKAKNTPAEPVFTLYHLDSTIKTENLTETSWMYNRLEFRGDNFEELAKKLERWYNVKINFEDSAVQQLNFNGSFEKETIEQAFVALKAAVPFDYTINKNKIFVRSGKTTMP
jgi:ferric-dicitrate binding protein FerR (iron transport regulator)